MFAKHFTVNITFRVSWLPQVRKVSPKLNTREYYVAKSKVSENMEKS